MTPPKKRQRDYAAEYWRRQQLAAQRGFKNYWAMRVHDRKHPRGRKRAKR